MMMRTILNRYRTLDERGQGVVEYLMMISVVVGVILVVGALFKPQIAGIFQQIVRMIEGAVRQVGA
jgi:Flp pilus assembly pilin Flp